MGQLLIKIDIIWIAIVSAIFSSSVLSNEIGRSAYGFHAFQGDAFSNFLNSGRAPSKTELDFIEGVMSALSLPQNFKVKIIPSSKFNAAALIKNETRIIIMGDQFLKSVKVTGKDWAAFGVLAHEMAHHLAGHTIESSGSTRTIELEADRKAGNMMALMGASDSEAIQAVSQLPELETNTHPGKAARKRAVIDGWQRAMETSNQAVLSGKCRELLRAKGHIDSFLTRSECNSVYSFHNWAKVPTKKGAEVTGIYLELGMDPNIQDSYGNTALHHAFQSHQCGGETEKVKMLMGSNADPTIVNQRGVSAIGKAWKSCCFNDGYHECDMQKRLAKSMAEQMNAHDELVNPWKFFDVAKKGSVQEFEYYLILGNKFDEKDDLGNTAFHNAALGCNIELIEYALGSESTSWISAARTKNKSGEKPIQILKRRCLGLDERLIQRIEWQSL